MIALFQYKKITRCGQTLLFFCFLQGMLSAQAQTVTQNYVRTRMPRRPMATNAKVDALTPNKDSVQSIIQYIDGLGRPLQTVSYQASPTGKDLVQPSGYDQYGREMIKYLPYSATSSDGGYKADALQSGAGLSQFYNSPPNGIAQDQVPYSVTVFEQSPLNRVVEQGAPGVPWQPISNSSAGHTIKKDYRINNTIPLSDTANSMWVALYTATANMNQSRTLSRNGSYGTGQLVVTVSKDENWRSGRAGTIETYTDKDGRVVLKRTFNYNGGTLQILSTYYVYDELGLLAYVLPPGASPDTAVPSAPNSTCYIYRYDERGRQVQKKIPGKGWEFTAYNKLDQAVLTQDSVQRTANQWTATKYDALGRIIMTGVWNAGSVIPLTTLQSNIGTVTQWDTRDYTGNTTSYPSGYVLGSYPVLTKTLGINYYDDYKGIPNFPTGYNVTNAVSNMTKGLLTASKTMVLNTLTNSTPDMLWGVIYYDDFGRTVRSYKQHYLGGTYNEGNFDVVINTYNFNNQVTTVNRRNFTSALAGNPTITINNQYIYDHDGRRIKNWEQITNAGQQSDFRTLVSKIDYDELGQLWKKNLHSLDSVNFKMTETYSYNERGWSLGKSSNQFVLLLQYNSGITPQYNGNLSGQAWLVAGSTSKSYAYNYDQLNRLVAGNSSDNNNENNITYDAMGNINTLNRYANNTLIDQLTYTYLANNVTLQSLNDATTNDAGLKHATTNYQYDGNGNLTSDDGKGITITYNMLNLPQSIAAKTTTYTYDAGGEKLARQIGTAKTDYVSGIQYDGSSSASTISFIQTEEGRAIPNGAITYNYEYSLSDHLGNSRVNFDTGTGGPRQVQTDDYYPFGFEISHSVIGTKNEYLYNKKELQENIGLYDYGARYYDPVIGKWTSPDPLAELGRRWSPYTYGKDNPIIMVDPDGMFDLIFRDKTLRQDGISRTLYIINQGLGGGDYASVDALGKVSLNVSAKQLKGLTDEQRRFYERIKAATETKQEVEIGIVSNSTEDMIGNYWNRTIDIQDIEHFGGSENAGADSYSVIIHEITEQVLRQTGNTSDVMGNHQKGIEAEEYVKGVNREPDADSRKHSPTLEFDSEGRFKSGVLEINYTDEKTKKVTTISIEVLNNNINSITRRTKEEEKKKDENKKN